MKEVKIITAQELRKRLKQHFGIKFSVRRQNITFCVTWVDGPTRDEVNKFVSKYNDNADDDPTTDLFVGCQYAVPMREYSRKYCSMLNEYNDLRSSPTVTSQMKNYMNFLIKRLLKISYYHYKGVHIIELEKEKLYNISLYNIDIVADCLKQQGHIVEVSNNNTKLTVREGIEQ